jgi:hypothetical protein
MTFSVIVYEGSPARPPKRKVGPFETRDQAYAWCEDEHLGNTQVEGEWAVVIPPEHRGETG